MPVISTNTAANSALVNLNRNSAAQTDFLTQLSSGSRINSSADDAAGLAVASQLQADITTLEQSSRNASQGQALLQTADGALARQGDILQRMKSLATQYNSGTVDAQSRSFINAEYTELREQLDLITSSTEFNGQALIDGTYNETFITGIKASDNVGVDLTTIDTTADGLGLSNSLSVSNTQIFSAELNTASGTASGTDTLQNLVSGLTFGAGETLIFTLDADADGTDGNAAGGFDITFTEGTDGSTVNDLVSFLNSQLDGAGANQALEVTFTNGELSVALANTSVLDTNDDGNVDALKNVGIAGTSTLNGTDSQGAAITANGDLVAVGVALSSINDDLTTIDSAIASVSQARSTVGAFTSALDKQGENVVTQIENLTAAKSSIVDVDIAEAQTKFTNAQVLTEAATAALSQANDMKTSLLQLLS